MSKARANGIKVTIFGGGSTSDAPEGDKADHVLKLGPLIYQRKALEMNPWRLPVPLMERLMAKFRSFPFMTLHVLIAFLIGLVIGRLSQWNLPYRIKIVRQDER